MLCPEPHVSDCSIVLHCGVSISLLNRFQVPVAEMSCEATGWRGNEQILFRWLCIKCSNSCMSITLRNNLRSVQKLKCYEFIAVVGQGSGGDPVFMGGGCDGPRASDRVFVCVCLCLCFVTGWISGWSGVEAIRQIRGSWPLSLDGINPAPFWLLSGLAVCFLLVPSTMALSFAVFCLFSV